MDRQAHPFFSFLVLLLSGWCGQGVGAELRFDFSGPGMGTTFRIACHAADREGAERAVDACFQRIARLNAMFSDYDPTSELMSLCAPSTAYPKVVSAEMLALLTRAREIAQITDGAFDPTCGHLSQLWRRTKRQGRLPAAARLQAGLEVTSWQSLILHPDQRAVTLKPGMLLDLGGIAKGHAADECLRVLREHGITRAIVQAGGDTRAGDPPPGKTGWEVLLRTFSAPDLEEKLETVLLANGAVSTSGDLYQFIEIDGRRYSHIIDPRTGLGLTQRIACSVFAPDCTTSDALATAMCVLGEEAGAKLAAHLPGVKVKFARAPSAREN